MPSETCILPIPRDLLKRALSAHTSYSPQPWRCHITELPLEMYEHIADYLPYKDSLELSLTCKDLHGKSQPTFKRYIEKNLPELFAEALAKRRFQTVQKFIQTYGVPDELPASEFLLSPLHGAIANDAPPHIVAMILDKKPYFMHDLEHPEMWFEEYMCLYHTNLSLDDNDDDVCTPLCTALMHKRADIMRVLLDRGAEFEEEVGPLFLQYAVMQGDKDMVFALLDAGAKIEFTTNTGEKSVFAEVLWMMSTYLKSTDFRYWSIYENLKVLVICGANLDLCRILLEKKKIEYCYRNSQWKPTLDQLIVRDSGARNWVNWHRTQINRDLARCQDVRRIKTRGYKPDIEWDERADGRNMMFCTWQSFMRQAFDKNFGTPHR